MSDTVHPYGQQPARLLCPWDSSGKSTGVGCRALLQGIFLTQGSNLYLVYLPILTGGFFTTSATWEALPLEREKPKHKVVGESGKVSQLLSVRTQLYVSGHTRDPWHASLSLLQIVMGFSKWQWKSLTQMVRVRSSLIKYLG